MKMDVFYQPDLAEQEGIALNDPVYDDYKKVYEIKEKETNTVTNDTKSKEREFCKKYTKFRYSTNYRIEQDINLTYSLRYGNSNYNKFEKLQEISNAKLCKLNNFYE